MYDLRWIIAEGATSGELWCPVETSDIPFLGHVTTSEPITFAADDKLYLFGTYDTDAA
jgi:hypothetical protein